MADKHTGADLNFIKDGLNKVEFIRTKNYLSKLAILISRQEKEIFKLTKKTRCRCIENLIRFFNNEPLF